MKALLMRYSKNVKTLPQLSTIMIVLIWSTVPSIAESGLHCRYSGDCIGGYGYGSDSNWVFFIFLFLLGIAYVYSIITKPRVTIVMTVGLIGTGIFYIVPMYIFDDKIDRLIVILISIGGAIAFFKIWSIVASKIAPEINDNK